MNNLWRSLPHLGESILPRLLLSAATWKPISYLIWCLRFDMTWYGKGSPHLDSAQGKELTCVITLWISWLRGSRKSYHRFTWSMGCQQLFHIYCRMPPFCSTWRSHKESHLEKIEGQLHPSRGMTPLLWNLLISCFNSELENSIKNCNTYHVWNIFRNGRDVTEQSCNSYPFYIPPTFRRRWCPPCRTECSSNFHFNR